MRFQITAGGYAAGFNKSNMGPWFQIAKFRVGSGFGYDAVIADDRLRGNILHTGTPVGYRSLGGGSSEFSIIISENFGSWEFGEIGLYDDHDVLVAIGTLQRPQYKVAYPDRDFNRFHVRVRWTFQDNGPVITLVMNELVAGSIWELPSIEQLPLPGMAVSNAYLCHSLDTSGNDALCTLNPTRARWTIQSHPYRVETGKITEVLDNGNRVRAGVGRLAPRAMRLGRYLFQLTSGANSGQIRPITALENGTASWLVPLSVNVDDTYEILADGEYAVSEAEDAAFFFSLLSANK